MVGLPVAVINPQGIVRSDQIVLEQISELGMERMHDAGVGFMDFLVPAVGIGIGGAQGSDVGQVKSRSIMADLAGDRSVGLQMGAMLGIVEADDVHVRGPFPLHLGGAGGSILRSLNHGEPGGAALWNPPVARSAAAPLPPSTDEVWHL